MEQLLEKIVEQLSELRGDVKQLQSGQVEMETRLREEMHSMGSELRQEMHAMGSELRQEMHAMGSELRHEMNAIGSELRHEMNDKWQELRQSIDSLADEQVEMRKEIAFYYNSTMKKLEETRSELKSEIVQLGKIQQQHQAVLEYLNNRGH
jgi:DNA repair exonuclease SbcCD ATPase subunit